VVAQGETDVRRCPSCKNIAPTGVSLCPICGGSLEGESKRNRRSRGLPVLAGALLVAVLLAFGARRLDLITRSSARCLGGQNPKVEWRTSDAKPSFDPGHLFQIENAAVPFIKLADIRTTGNRSYGDKCDSEWGHIHDPVYAAVMREGANAYYNHPAQRLAGDSVEVVVTAVLVHAGPVPQEIKDRHFPAGRALMVVHLLPNTVAEKSGLRPGDLMAVYKGRALHSGRGFEMEGIPIVEDERVEMTVIRDGQEVNVSMVRHGSDKLGYNWGEVPLLEASL
jgi:predicted nucleic acid-binding Zn ribbon protein